MRKSAHTRSALDNLTVRYKSIESILKHKLDQQPLPEKKPENPSIAHGNLRGADYYH